MDFWLRIADFKMAFSSLSLELQTTILQHVCKPDYRQVADLRLVSQNFRSLLSADAFWRSPPANCQALLDRPNVFRPLVVANLTCRTFVLPAELPLDQHPRLLDLEARSARH
ncbi:MAG: hypothetical protein EOO77_34310 [Oxalobacteraceae bacterium]|nr:MAG: hypothetical protein EOO77_34310 [Oxalobacteraceae bacterium]